MSVKKIQPEFLKPGDEVAIISPSFFIDESKLNEGVTLLEGWGLKVHVGRNAAKQNGPFAGSDEERLADLQEMTDNKSVKAVICSRGGYGISKIINKVDFSALRKNPKWYTGFSDVTVLHMWLNEVCGLMSVHGEMPLNFNNHEKSPETIASLKDALFGNFHPIKWDGAFTYSGKVSGELTGGNLSLLYSLTGTEAEPSTRGKILFIEEVGEYFYHIDRMLTSLKLVGKLDGLAALLVGGMNNMTDSKTQWGRSIEDTISEITKEFSWPVLFGFPSGHINDNRAFYLGRKAQIDIKRGKAVLSFI